jgi:predicted dehydrogenase
MTLPLPVIIDPQSYPSLRWGIIGPGGIAEVFVGASQKHTSQIFSAVASRTTGRAQDFAEKFSIPKVHQNYGDLVADPDLDAIYIASWQVEHFEHAMLALNAGKHVLVEKPITVLPEHAEAIFALAKEKGLLAMEAMWTRYLPQSTIIRQLLESGELGTPELFAASFCADNRAISRLWQKGGGGIVYDMGIYNIAMAQQFMGNPVKITAIGSIDGNKMDLESFALLEYANGSRAHLTASGIATIPTSASCSFEKATLVIEEPFFVPSGMSLRDKELYFTEQTWQDTSAIQGHEALSYQATWFAKYVAEGRVESEVHTAQDTIANIRVAQEITAQLGAEII